MMTSFKVTKTTIDRRGSDGETHDVAEVEAVSAREALSMVVDGFTDSACEDTNVDGGSMIDRTTDGLGVIYEALPVDQKEAV
jgi:hypothetical protein